MKILIIGGTKFVGRHLIEAAIDSGHEVTIFHRGKNSPQDLPAVDEILGDRNSDLDKLSGREWDAIIDTCGYLPQPVRASAEALKDSTSKYVFISSISAYSDFSEPDFNEDAALAAFTPEQKTRFEELNPLDDLNAYVLGDMYGALKAICEAEVTNIYGPGALVIRPGLIVGKYDWTDRFTYWVMRIAEGGKVAAPGDPNAFVQFIDGRDLAEWTISMIENGESGIYNATGKPFSLPFGEMLDKIQSATGGDPEYFWMTDRFMEEQDVAPWSDMPVYLPQTGGIKGHSSANIDRAVKKGLQFRDLTETVESLFEWRRSIAEEIKAGISREREKDLVTKLRERNA